MFRRISLLVCCSLASASAIGATSVWDEARRDANVVTGKVVSIATNDNEVLVRISDGAKTETYKVCAVYPGGDGLNIAENERMRSLRDAFNKGDKVKVSYNGPFDRCISTVELNKEEDVKPVAQPVKKTADISKKHSYIK